MRIISQDHDLQQMYFDSFLRIACLEGKSEDELLAVIDKLEKLSGKFETDFILSVSMDESELPARLKDKVLVSL